MSRQRIETGRRRHFWLNVDEFQNFITPSMAEILSEARKYRLGLVLAHQSLSQMQRGSDVSDAGFDKIILICPNPRKREGLSAALETHFASNPVPVICIPPSELENQLRQTPPETTQQMAMDPAPPPAANKKPRGYAVKREFADGTHHQPLPESKAMEILAKIMRPKKDEEVRPYQNPHISEM